MNVATTMSPQPAHGLASAEATRRLAQYGPNEIRHEQATSPWRMLAGQFASPVIWLLLGACVISALLDEVADAVAIGTILVLNALVGFFQEYRAERAVLALRSMTAPRARVVRDGHITLLPATHVVPGDVLVLEAGDVVAADARLLLANALTANEATLTGESMPVQKSVVPVSPGTVLAERSDSVFTGTSIASGTGHAEVVATGMRTEFGKIADLLATAESGPTPLEQRLARVSQMLLYLCLGIVAVVAVLGLLRGLGFFEVFLSAVSLAVAAVPEGLPAIVTISLAIGVQRMAARNVLVRNLQSVETLGCATVICTDKTGTLTTGIMTVRELWGSDHAALIDAAAACCDADLAQDEQGGTGDPTEIAILVEAAHRGIRQADIERARPRRAVHPFAAERKRMSILRADGTLYVKGALEALLPLCSGDTTGAAEANAQMAARGLRVLAVALGTSADEAELRLAGLIGIADPPRSEAIDAVAAARRAGIETVMITGDHPVTAQAIARELGILAAGQPAEEVVHARATPERKLTIVRDWKKRGAVVAMTGDGVNDAPALREASVGICMGKTGTEVTREASDMVLADDNFASIVAAIREGRGIFDNIRKALVYLLSGNTGELAVMLVASIVGLPLPLLPLHLLWINLVTDGLPALALVMDPTDVDTMTRPPRRPDEPMLGRSEWRRIVFTGVLEAAVALGEFAWTLAQRDLAAARSMAFSVIVFAELFRSFAARSPTKTLWEVGVLSNLALVAVVSISVLLQLALHYVPLTRTLFQLGPISLAEGARVLLIGLAPVSALELSKLVRRALRKPDRPSGTGVAPHARAR
jgi:Ca2+-transporting ATPase